MDEVEGSRSAGFLAVEIVTGDATQAGGSDHLVTGILGFADVDDFGEGRFFERVDLRKSVDEVADIFFAELGHAGVEVFALAAAVEEDFGEPGFGELGADVGEGGREAALVAEGFGGAGEVGVALGGDPAEAFAIVTGDAVEGGE